MVDKVPTILVYFYRMISMVTMGIIVFIYLNLHKYNYDTVALSTFTFFIAVLVVILTSIYPEYDSSIPVKNIGISAIEALILGTVCSLFLDLIDIDLLNSPIPIMIVGTYLTLMKYTFIYIFIVLPLSKSNIK